MPGFRQEVGHFAGVDARLAFDALGQKFPPARLEGAMQPGHQIQGVVGQDFVETGMQWRVDGDAIGQLVIGGWVHGWLSPMLGRG